MFHKHTLIFKSKSPLNVSDEEWLLFFRKKKIQFSSAAIPPHAHIVEGWEGRIFCTEMFIIGRNLTI